MFGRKKPTAEIKVSMAEETDDEPFFSIPASNKPKHQDSWANDELINDNAIDGDEEDDTVTTSSGLTSWINEEDKLPIDVYQDDSYIYLKSPVPGADVEDIDINIDNDLITIRVHRESSESINQDDYFFQECFWGSLSRSLILPAEIEADAVQANLRNGILTVTLPKINRSTGIRVSVQAEE